MLLRYHIGDSIFSEPKARSVSGPDFDAIAEQVSPEQLARAIGARPSSSADFHCSGPAHTDGDKNPSLSINRPNGRTIAYCHSCGLKGTPVQVAAELWGMTPNDAAQRLVSEIGITTTTQSNGRAGHGGNRLGELVATYDYPDADGEYLFSVRRFALPKGFRQGRRQGTDGWAPGRGGTPDVLYRLPEVVAGVEAGRHILIVEGEKDADELARRGFVATTNVGGAGAWKPGYAEWLCGAKAYVLPDNDPAGLAHGQEVARALDGIASEVHVLELPGLPKKGDVSDWFGAGGTDKELRALVTGCPIWDPNATVVESGSVEDTTQPFEWPEHPHLPGPPEPEPLPLDALPSALRDMARTSHEATQAPLDSAIGAVIGAVSVAIVGKVSVEICPRREWIKPAHTYVGIEQTSGTGKSPILAAVVAPITAWEAAEAKKEDPRRNWNAEQVRLAEERVTAIRKDLVKAKPKWTKDELEWAVNELAEARAKPHSDFQLLVQDCTEEELIRIMEGNLGRAASVDSEGTILEVAAGRYGNGDARLAALTHGWDGEAMRVNRVTRKRVDLPSANLALLLAIQPGVLAQMKNAETMRQRGVLARFIWIAPPIRWDELLTGRDVPSLDRDAVTRYAEMLTRLLNSSDKSEGQPHLLRMSPEAQEGVHRLERAKVDGMRPGGPLQSVPAFAGKLPDHGARIAALLTLADRAAREKDLFHDPIPGWAMESAERLISAVSTHVVKATGKAGEDPELSDLLYLMERAEKMAGSTESDIREKARARESFRNAKYAKKMFDELERCGFIRRIPQERVLGAGRHPSPRIEINPTLRGSDFSDKSQFIHPTSNRSDKSEGDVGEDENYRRLEREAIQAETSSIEAPEFAENPTLDLLTEGAV